MKQKLLLVSVLAGLVVFANGCTKGCSVGCSIEDAGVSALTGYLTSKGCKGEDAIKSDLRKAAGKLKLCDREEQKALGIGGTVCKVIVGAVLDGVVQGVVSPAWQCPSEIADDPKKLLGQGCDLIDKS